MNVPLKYTYLLTISNKGSEDKKKSYTVDVTFREFFLLRLS